jgi:hypothetical protein
MMIADIPQLVFFALFAVLVLIAVIVLGAVVHHLVDSGDGPLGFGLFAFAAYGFIAINVGLFGSFWWSVLTTIAGALWSFAKILALSLLGVAVIWAICSGLAYLVREARNGMPGLRARHAAWERKRAARQEELERIAEAEAVVAARRREAAACDAELDGVFRD